MQTAASPSAVVRASAAHRRAVMPGAVPTLTRSSSSPTASRRGTPPTSYRRSPRRGGSPVEFRGFVTRQRTFSGDERAGAYLREAALRGDAVGTVKWMAAGAEQAAVVNSADTYGTTALHNATQYSRTEIIKALLESGADPNATDTAGRTPLHQASQFGAIEAVRELLLAGANLVADNAGMTARDYAVKHKHDAIVDMIDSATALSSVRERVTTFSGKQVSLDGTEPTPVEMLGNVRKATGVAARSDEAREYAQPLSLTPLKTTVEQPTRKHRAKLVVQQHEAVQVHTEQMEATERKADDELRQECVAEPAATDVAAINVATTVPTDTACSAKDDIVELPEGSPSNLLSVETSYHEAAEKAAAVATAAEAAHNAVAEAKDHAAHVRATLTPLSKASLDDASPPPLSPEGEDDPNDPMATIRRLARQHRSRHFHRRLAARDDQTQTI